MKPFRVSREEPGFVVSAVTHGAVLVLALLGFADAKTFEDAQESVSVEMISEAEMKQLTQGEKTAKQVIPDAKLRVDKVAPQQKQDDPGEKKQELAAPQPAPALPPVRPSRSQNRNRRRSHRRWRPRLSSSRLFSLPRFCRPCARPNCRRRM